MLTFGLHLQKPSMSGLAEFLKPLNDVIVKGTKMTEGRRSDLFNHLKAAVDSLTALAWIAYTGKDCGRIFSIFFALLLTSPVFDDAGLL